MLPFGPLATKLLLGTLGFGAPACQQEEKVGPPYISVGRGW